MTDLLGHINITPQVAIIFAAAWLIHACLETWLGGRKPLGAGSLPALLWAVSKLAFSLAVAWVVAKLKKKEESHDPDR
jgi:hypothetical protein